MRIRFIPFALLLIFLAATGLSAQSSNPRDLRTGKFLVAIRKFPDPTFAQTVIVLTRYGENGAMGLIINRRTEVPMARAMPWATSSDPIYSGGPVSAPAVYGLLRAPFQPQQATPVLGDIYMIAERDQIQKVVTAAPARDHFHAYVGYCGWGPGQLENEVEEGAWYIFSGRAEMVFDREPASLWERLVSLTEQHIARLIPARRPGSAF